MCGRILEEGEGVAEVRDVLGVLLRGRGDLRGAEREHRKAIALQGEVAGFWNNLGVVLTDLGRLGEAAEVLGKGVELGGDWQVMGNLGVVYTRLGRVCGRLGEILLRGIGAGRGSIRFWYNLGNLREVVMGDLSGAAGAYRGGCGGCGGGGRGGVA